MDLAWHDTYFVVAHFHYVMAIAAVFAMFAGFYYWFPKMSGRMYHEGLAKAHFWCTFLGTYAIYLPMHYLGFLGVPRRYYALGSTDFIPASAQDLNATITIAALFVGAAQLLFFINIFWSNLLVENPIFSHR